MYDKSILHGVKEIPKSVLEHAAVFLANVL